MRFWAGLAMAMAGLSLGWYVLFAGQLGRQTPSSRWVAEVRAIKLARAESLAGQRKLVLVSGSNALFGLDSGRLERAWGLPVFNGAVNAGLLLPYVLESSKALIGPGDVVLMPLEYPMFGNAEALNSIVIDYVLARDPAYWSGLPWRERLRFLADVEPLRLWKGWRNPPDRSVGQGVYGGHHVDVRGDQTHSAAADRTDQERAELAATRPWRYGRDNPPDPTAWRRLVAYRNWLQQRGACLLLLPPTLLFDVSYRTDPVEHRFYASLPVQARAQGLVYVGNPYDFMYPRDWYFNTDYHLTAEGRARHTGRVISLLGPDLGRWCGWQGTTARP